jgi:AraC family transcriptional regulator of adaptative response/methylated-DNA-[protein]-cysteine methyltransferase
MNERRRLGEAGRPPTDSEWSAIEDRRRQPEPSWLLVVTSTGIVCMPGCPARTPGRDRVRIVRSLQEGLAAGARPCLRCRPDVRGWLDRKAAARRRDAGVTAVEPSALVRAATERLTEALDKGEEPPTARDLAAALGCSERRLRETFREVLGVTPRAWLAARRGETLRSRLRHHGDVLSAVFDSGYGSSSTAYEAANGELGMAPGRYRSGGAGSSIRWTVTSIPDGLALVGATDRGLCAVRLGERTDALEAELRHEFPAAEIERDDRGLADVARIVSDLAVGRRRPEADSLPLDVHATAFRRRVWEALRSIPSGETRSYGQVAAAVGAPKAARAVGAACAANPVAVVVPCHRVVASDGSLHGYAYGLARKRQLLDAERRTRESHAGSTPEPDEEAVAAGA